MTRQARTLALLAVIAVVGVVALGLLARRYASLAPARSVADLKPADAAPASGGLRPDLPAETAPEPEPVPEAPASAPEPSPPVQTPAAEDPAGRLVDAFAAVRADIRQFHQDRPHLAETWLRETRGETGEKGKIKNFQKLVAFRATKENALAREELDLPTYNRVRESYRAWRAGTAPPDPALAAAMDARRARLEEVSLGDYEPIDF